MRGLLRLLLVGLPNRGKNRLHSWRHRSQIHPSCTLASRSEVVDSVMDAGAAVAHHGSVRRSTVGRYSSIGRYSKVCDARIGAFCSISWDCTIGAHKHPMANATTHHFPFTARFGGASLDRQQDLWRSNTGSALPSAPRGRYPRPGKGTVIGNDVWVSANAVVLDGVRVGDGAVIGAGAVVTEDVEPYSVVFGVPALVVRRKFSDDLCSALVQVKWWDWPDELLIEHIELFQVPITAEIVERLEAACASSRMP